MNLPNVDAAFFGAAMKLQAVLEKAPLPAAEYQAAIGNLRGVVEHVEGLTNEVSKLREELSKVSAQPATAEK